MILRVSFVLIFLCSSRLSAQEERLLFVYTDGYQAMSQLVSVRDSSVLLYSGPYSGYSVLQDSVHIHRVDLSRIILVKRTPRGSFGRGFWTGAAIGAGVGLIISAASLEWFDTNDESEFEDWVEGWGNALNFIAVLGAGVAGGLLGGLIGGSISASQNQKEDVVYRPGDGTARLRSFAIFPDQEPRILQFR